MDGVCATPGNGPDCSSLAMRSATTSTARRTRPAERADGRWGSADYRLVATWRIWTIAARFGTPPELTLVDAIVAGDVPTPLNAGRRRIRSLPARPQGPSRRPADTAAALLATRQRGDLGIRPEFVTWTSRSCASFIRTGPFFLRVPRPAAQRLERLWASGTLDEPLTTFATHPATGALAKLDEPSAGLFDEVEAPAVAAARMEVAKTATPPISKPKRRMLPPPHPRRQSRRQCRPPARPCGRGRFRGGRSSSSA